MQAVGVTAQQVVQEVRRQFEESGGRIMSGQQRPDYHRCVEIVTRAALVEMRKPGLLAVAAPTCCGIFMRLIAGSRDPLIGAKASAAFL